MRTHSKKMIAPIVISILVVCYCVVYGVLVLTMEMPPLVKIVGAIIMAALIGTMIYVLIERILITLQAKTLKCWGW